MRLASPREVVIDLDPLLVPPPAAEPVALAPWVARAGAASGFVAACAGAAPLVLALGAVSVVVGLKARPPDAGAPWAARFGVALLVWGLLSLLASSDAPLAVALLLVAQGAFLSLTGCYLALARPARW